MTAVTLLAALFFVDPQPFTTPASAEQEYGPGLTAEDSRAGWIALFDGETAFGWKDAVAKEGQLSGGRTMTAFGDCEIRGEAVAGGKLQIGGEAIAVPEGAFKMTSRGGQAGPIGLGSGVKIKSLAVRPLGLKDAFNGKDLTGWTVLPHPKLAAEKQAKWSVAGKAISAVGGPGAIELDGRYGDLVLQVEVRTRAKLVNGGVFFRAIPGDFMNGYEAQVFNACYDRDPAKPARYSTGAIDDRQLARRLVSRDLVPFTMTVIAVGPHLATWVNGRQMTDWIDTRAKHANPREGLRLEPGTIQLQAHDPETDLEFRSVRVGELR